MSKSTFRTVEFCLSIFSVICIALFLILGDRFKGDIILWILSGVLLLSVFQAFRVYLNEINSYSKESISKDYLGIIIRYAFSKNKFDTILKIIEMVCFIWLSFIYENGILLLPFAVSLVLVTLRINMEDYDRRF